MTERWRRPLTVLDMEPGREMMLDSDGKVHRSTKVVYDRESTERIRLGYACARCMEVFEVPWPVACPTCKAPVRSRQAEYYAREFGGTERIGSALSLADEQGALPERATKEKEKP